MGVVCTTYGGEKNTLRSGGKV